MTSIAPLSFPLTPARPRRSSGRLARLLPVALVALAVGCSVETVEGPKPAVEPKITWTNAPKTEVVLKQGISTELPFMLSGDARVSFAAPAGVTVTREGNLLRLLPDYEATGTQTLEVSLTGSSGATSKTIVTTTIKPLKWAVKKSWTEGAGPEGREHPSVFIDQEHGVTYMFQGSGYHPQYSPLEDSWKFDMVTQTWSPWKPTGDVPAKGLSRRAAGPAKDGSYLLHGGELESAKLDPDLYRLDMGTGGDAASFKKLTQVNPPPLRSLHFFGMDAALGKSVLFGGFSYESSSTLNDTWILTTSGDTATWRKVDVPTKSSPSGRYGGFSALDERTHKFYVYSGGQMPKSGNSVNPAQDTWVFDMQAETWSLLETTGTTPAGRRNGCVMHDTVHGRMFVFGGTPNGKVSEKGLFVLDLARGAWSEVAGEFPHVRSSGMGFFDAKTGRVFCGFGNDDDVYLDTNGFGYDD